jgi:hypothetical protein
MKKLMFLVAFASGAVVATKWRVVAKQSIKGGILASRKLKEMSEQVKEDLQDVAAEATEEILRKDQEAESAR